MHLCAYFKDNFALYYRLWQKFIMHIRWITWKKRAPFCQFLTSVEIRHSLSRTFGIPALRALRALRA